MTWAHFNLIQRLQGISAEECTCLDLGCGTYFSDVARQVLELPWKSLTSVDGYVVDLDKASQKQTSAKDWKLEKGDVRQWVVTTKEKFDVVLSFDVLEHLTKEDGLAWLKALENVTNKRIVLFLPIEPDGYHRKPEDDNPLQEHLSHWKPHELQALGYSVEVISDCHSEKQEDGSFIHYGAMWAIKNL